MTENRVFQHLTHQKYAKKYADSESGNGFFLAPVQEWFISKILMPKNSKFEARNSATNKSVTGSDGLHVRLGSSRFFLNVLKISIKFPVEMTLAF